MLDKLRNSYNNLLKSEKFENIGFLCGAFIMCKLDEIEKREWQIDFYDPKAEEMITYTIDGDIKIERSKAFKNEYEIKELNIEDVRVDINTALKRCSELLAEYHDVASKIIIVLQRIKRLMWNITYITDGFNILNVKIDAKNGKILEKNFSSMLEFRKD